MDTSTALDRLQQVLSRATLPPETMADAKGCLDTLRGVISPRPVGLSAVDLLPGVELNLDLTLPEPTSTVATSCRVEFGSAPDYRMTLTQDEIEALAAECQDE
jgi:hypothetical protein